MWLLGILSKTTTELAELLEESSAQTLGYCMAQGLHPEAEVDFSLSTSDALVVNQLHKSLELYKPQVFINNKVGQPFILGFLPPAK